MARRPAEGGLERCRGLIEAADELRYQDPEAAVAQALRARDLAADLDRALIGDGPWLRLQSLAWGVLASTYRGTSDLHRAESSLAVSLAFLGDAPDLRHEPTLAPRLAQRAAYLRCDQGRYDEALELTRDAIEGFRATGDEHLVGCALLDRALVYHRSGRTERAIQILTQAVESIDQGRDPRCYLAAVHNMAVYLQRVARTETDFEEALHWLRLAVAEHERLPERVSLLKLRGLVALCHARLATDEKVATRARLELRAVRDEFRRLGATSHEAVMLLHAAQLAVDDGDDAELRRLAGEVFPLLGRLPKNDAGREALLGFHAACRRRTVTTSLLSEVIARFEDRSYPAQGAWV